MGTAVGWSEFVANAGRLGVLAVPALLGAGVARRRVLSDVPSAVDALNVYTLRVGFPSLIVVGVLAVDGAVARQWGWWVAIPLVDVLLVAVAAAAGRRRLGSGGSTALVLLFGNTAYLGLPFVVSVFGESVRGPSLLVAVQVGLAVLVGPILLHRWSGAPGGRGPAVDLGRLARQPLFLAPFVGAAARVLPTAWQGALGDVLQPIAASTAPVAMFLLGLHLADSWDRIGRGLTGVGAHVVARLAVAPVVGAAVGVLLWWAGALPPVGVALLTVLGAMPAAISTFSLAHQERVAADLVAAVVVWSSLSAVVTLPVVATAAQALAEWLSRR